MSSSEDSESCVSSSSDDKCEHTDNLDLKNNILKKYNIISEIGRGGDAIVWLGYNIEDQKYYAIKVYGPDDYKKTLEEIAFLRKLPKDYNVFNHLKDDFVEEIDKKKYVCAVFELHSCDLDRVLRKSKLEDGLPIPIVKKIMVQLLTAIRYMHKNIKAFHCDIKTDNILLKGINNYDLNIIQQYDSMNFSKLYQSERKNGKIKDKTNIRKTIHKNLCDKIIFQDKSEKNNIIVDNELSISLSDFGTFCYENESFNSDFGTRYYLAPETILKGDISYGVDIWACGCVFYELLTGVLLFDPSKTSKYSRDDFHLLRINEICGNFPLNFIKKTKYWKDFFNKNGELLMCEPNKINMKELLKKHNVFDCLDEIIELLEGMLQINPKKRFTVDDCLNHKFLSNC